MGVGLDQAGVCRNVAPPAKVGKLRQRSVHFIRSHRRYGRATSREYRCNLRLTNAYSTHPDSLIRTYLSKAVSYPRAMASTTYPVLHIHSDFQATEPAPRAGSCGRRFGGVAPAGFLLIERCVPISVTSIHGHSWLQRVRHEKHRRSPTPCLAKEPAAPGRENGESAFARCVARPQTQADIGRYDYAARLTASSKNAFSSAAITAGSTKWP